MSFGFRVAPLTPLAGRADTSTMSAETCRRVLWHAIAVVIALGGLATTATAADGLRIVPLVRDDSVLVSFELTDGYTEAVRDAVRSGLKTTFTYAVDLRQDVPAWVDRTIATSVVTISVQYDNLTRIATLVRTVDGRVVSTETTEDEDKIPAWMTTFQKVPLFRTADLERNREYYVRVRATARPTNGSMLWPWGSGISGITKFTFLP